MGTFVRVLMLAVVFSFMGRPMLVAQINTDRVMLMGRNALYYEDYVLAIQRFNWVIDAKPWLGEPYFLRALAKFYLEDNQGAELDCTQAVERNPYVDTHFLLRAQCRINQRRFDLAEEDYKKALEIDPLNRNAWHDLTICQIEQKAYSKADSSLDVMLRNWSKVSDVYAMKAQVSFYRQDTASAENWVNKALEINAYDGTAWSMNAMILANRGEYVRAEDALDRAILQFPRNAGLYINRALARFHQDDFRGAMSDYDMALDMEPSNYLGHFNRGLLRAQVGEDNLAVEDFNFVLNLEPDNTIALYNRALLLNNIGDYEGAIRDISAVIDDYPDFWEGYRKRAEIRRKIGDVYGAERDEFKILKARMAVATGNYKSSGKTRKKSENRIEDYDKLVEDDEQETENEYASIYRGKVQNRKTELQVMPLYVFAYHSQSQAIQSYVVYTGLLESLNSKGVFPLPLVLTNSECALNEEMIQKHFDRIAHVTDELASDSENSTLLLQRAMDYYHVRDFENAIADLNSVLVQDDKNVCALMLRAQSRFAQMTVEKSGAVAPKDLRLGYLMVLQDYAQAVEQEKENPYLHYNLGNLYEATGDYPRAIASYTEALKLDERFPAAYYNRGVVQLLNGNSKEGLIDLSQAGEYGLYSAYNLIKKHSNSKK